MDRVPDSSGVIIQRIAAFGLQGAPDPERTVPGASWPQLRSRIRWERLTGLAVDSIAAGWLELTDEQAGDLLAAHREAMVWVLGVERKLLTVAEAFDAEGIGFAVLKGVSVAHTAYPDPCLRSFGDLDLLVRTADYERTGALLRSLGHVRQRPEPCPGWEVRFGKASVHKHPDDAIEIDLHRTLVLGPFGLWIKPEEMLERAVPFGLGDRQIPRLDDTGMLLNVALHASLGFRPPRLVPLRDVAQVSGTGSVDWETLTRWAAEWRLAEVFRHAFTTAATVLEADMSVGDETFTDVRSRRGDRRALQAYTGSERASGGTALSTLRAIPGLHRKVAYVRALAFPQREFMQGRYATGSKSSYGRRLLLPGRWAWRRLVTARTKET